MKKEYEFTDLKEVQNPYQARKEALGRKLTDNEIEAANRAEVTAILIRLGYRVYRPEADCFGEDLILRTPNGELRIVQLKSRPTVDWNRYGKGQCIWMLFPDPKNHTAGRKWFLVPHDEFYAWVKNKHGHTAKWSEAWSDPTISKELGRFLDQFTIHPFIGA